ncbi:hypothetical protein F5876DRAFT_78371 [Lentinula aff. lateritia]|uniref:Uncharacterized protein n=1 Tax=Lentinula aff. lateritia TaxID=2804960 RepID=A0ACC1TWH1_9AGAR|nr:hypothetical protein F5876DRAFT_78371 [Lentinula aff. lateritia]
MLSRIKLTPRSFGRQISAFHFSHCNAYASRIRLATPLLVQHRGIRTKPETSRLKPRKDGPTAGERVLMQRMLEQRQLNISKVARERGWFFPSKYLQLPFGWSYEWPAWVAGWELVPIVNRSHNELVLEHYFAMSGKSTPIIFHLDPHAPDFIFRYKGMDAQDIQRKGTSWMDQGIPGAYYYFRMGDDEVFKFPSEFDTYSPEEFILASGSTPGLVHMMKETSVVSVSSDDHSSYCDTFAEECDLELIQFEERLADLENETKGKDRAETIMSLAFGDFSMEEPLYPITHEKILALRKKYESYKAYGVYSVYSLVPDDDALKAEARRKRHLQYYHNVENFEDRVEELKRELHEITDDEGEFEVVKQQSRGRRQKRDNRPRQLSN